VLAMRQLVDREIAPDVAAHESEGRIPAALVQRLADLGALGALVPPELGGLGLDLGTYAMLLEELARGWASAAGLVRAQAVAAGVVARFGPRAERERLAPPMTRGERWVAPAAGGRIRARQAESGHSLHGSAPMVELAARADALLVRAEGDAGLFVVARAAPGVRVAAPSDPLGGRGLGAADLELDGAAPSARLADGAADALDALERLSDAAIAVGLSQAAFEAALRYSQQRTAFGQPICQHQAIQLKLADMATRITAARLLTYRAAERLERDEAGEAGALMARIEAVGAASSVTLESMRIHGGYGYTREFPVERLYRDAAWLRARRPLDADRAELARRWTSG
jgi:alkylation response protein AidB-like acyl-CoA dehydrogenase